MARKLGICLSGGGHRATAFSLGALMYVVDSGRNTEVSAISSVSGGSIANAFIATLPKEFSNYTADQFEGEVAKFAHQIAGSPRWWNIAVTLYFVLLGGWAWETYRHFPNNLLSSYHLYFIVLIVAWAFLIGPLCRGTLWCWWGTWLYCGLLIFAMAWNAVLGMAWYVGVPWVRRLTLWPILLLALLLLVVLFLRGQIAEWAFAHTINNRESGGKGAGRPLESLPRAVRHVFCATELHSGRHAYYSHDLIYVPFVGVGEPAGMKLSTAVQVSANFPLAFPARALLRRRKQEFVEGSGIGRHRVRLFALTDGGVYDNTGASWFLEVDERPDLAHAWSEDSFRTDPPAKFGLLDQSVRKRASRQLEEMRSRPDQLIVVNASEPEPWRAVGAALLPVVGELKDLPDATLITYAVRGKEQAREQMHRFLRPDFRRNLQGVTVSAAWGPTKLAIALGAGRGKWDYEIVLKGADVDDSVITRARAVHETVIKRIEDLELIVGYPYRGMHYICVPTTLRPLGESATANLLWLGYFQTMVNAAVMLDNFPILQPCPPDRERFKALAAGRPRPRPPISKA